MKAFFLSAIALTVLATAAPAHAGVQKFIKEKLSYRMYGPGDFGSPWMKRRCDEADQAVARQSAEEEARHACEAAPGVNECLVKSSRITVNGALDARTLAKYGMQERGDAYGYWGCEAQAIVYGLD